LCSPCIEKLHALQLLNGENVTDDEDREAMRKFVQDAVDGNNVLQYLGMDAYSNPNGRLPGYVTCRVLRDSFAQVQPGGGGQWDGAGSSGGMGGANRAGGGGGGGASGGGGGSGGSAANVSNHGIPMDPICTMIIKLYRNNEKALTNCAFIVDLFGFQRCILSLTKVYDLRQFFGGMS
jgi:hypothetical protein